VSKSYNLDKEDPMTMAGLLVQEDIALLLPGIYQIVVLLMLSFILPPF
jgi:hypothetical protein